MHKFTYTQIKRFKLEAKTRSRASEIGHIKALDCIAHEQGFGNWSLLMKTAAPDTDDSVASFKFIRTNDDMRSAMRNRLEIFDRVPGRYAPPNMDVASIWNEIKLPPAKPEVYCWGASKALVTLEPPKGGYSPNFIWS
ncbi:hypothetical protein [Undibacterium sp. Tian12W]|uniref:hypothetical protein n=1 Tax=Undibacterium sp. Tian12W TaxID=3413054 RepID=UPI003BF1F3AA